MLTRLFLTLALATVFLTATNVHADCGADHGDAKTTSATADIVDTAVAADSFETLVAAVQAAGLVDVLKGDGPFTVFAPNDAAFAKLPEGTIAALLEDKQKLAEILTYHVVPGKVMAADVVGLDFALTAQGQSLYVRAADGSVMIDGATVVATDIETSNGVIHVIDTVVMPRQDIVATAVEAGDFNTLTAALEAADLTGTLANDGPFTVFAPTDAAFAKLPEGTLEALLGNVPELKGLLTYHVVSGRMLASNIAEKGAGSFNVTSLAGDDIKVTVKDDGTVMVNNAKVVATDIISGNGIIHVIDGVIMPSQNASL